MQKLIKIGHVYTHRMRSARPDYSTCGEKDVNIFVKFLPIGWHNALAMYQCFTVHITLKIMWV